MGHSRTPEDRPHRLPVADRPLHQLKGPAAHPGAAAGGDDYGETNAIEGMTHFVLFMAFLMLPALRV
jgi:hypothetical protein